MPKKQTFEQAMARLEEIVRLLEKGDAPLEESMSLFEEGAKLAAQLGTQLDKAEQKVSLMTADAQGRVTEQPFDGGEALV